MLLSGNWIVGFLGSCFFFLLLMAIIPTGNIPNIIIGSKSGQLKKSKFVDPESAVSVGVGVDVGVGIDIEGTIEIGVDVGVFVNDVGLTVEVGGVVEVGVGVGVEVEVSANVAEIE